MAQPSPSQCQCLSIVAIIIQVFFITISIKITLPSSSKDPFRQSSVAWTKIAQGRVPVFTDITKKFMPKFPAQAVSLQRQGLKRRPPEDTVPVNICCPLAGPDLYWAEPQPTSFLTNLWLRQLIFFSQNTMLCNCRKYTKTHTRRHALTRCAETYGANI